MKLLPFKNIKSVPEGTWRSNVSRNGFGVMLAHITRGLPTGRGKELQSPYKWVVWLLLSHNAVFIGLKTSNNHQ